MNPIDTLGGERKFELKQEVILSDNLPFHFSMAFSANNYLITGYIRGNQAWAARLDIQGKELWSYAIPIDKALDAPRHSHAWHSSRYKNAVSLKNGTTLICGNKDIGEEKAPIIKGLLTRVDQNGNLLDHRLLVPSGLDAFKINYILQCGAWGDAYFAAGMAVKFTKNIAGRSPPFLSESFFWLMALDTDGNVEWEKLISTGFMPSIERLPWLGMPNGDLVFSGAAPSIVKDTGSIGVTSIIRVDRSGEVKAQRNIIGQVQLVSQPLPAMAIRVVPIGLKDGMFIKTLNDDLSDGSYFRADKEEFIVKKVIEMPDRSIVLAGYRDYRNSYATLIHYTADLQVKNDFTFVPKEASSWVDDVVLTNNPNEIATIRSNNSGDYRNIFSFIKIH